MEISFDPAKDAANIQERGIPLAFGLRGSRKRESIPLRCEL
jgi:hypothetical protein